MLETLTNERAQTVRAAVKRVAFRQLAEGGPAAVAINAIARELGVSGPALYRYFKNRDALLTALVLDAYDDLADALDTSSLEAFAQSLPRLGAGAAAPLPAAVLRSAAGLRRARSRRSSPPPSARCSNC